MYEEENTAVESEDTFDKILNESNADIGWDDIFTPKDKSEESTDEDSQEEETPDFSDERPQNIQFSEEKNSKKRLSQNERLKKQLNEVKSFNQDLLNRLQQTEQQNHALSQRTLSQHYDSLEDKEKYWGVIKEDYKSALQGAYEGGAASSVADAADKMQIANLELEKIRNEKSNVAYQIEQVRNYTASPNKYPTSGEDENLNNFLTKYPFLSPDNNNPNYAPEAVAKVSKISSDLSTEYKMAGRGDEIRSADYFEELEQRMSKEINSKPARSSPTSRSSRMVAPVGKRTSVSHEEPSVKFSSHDKNLMMNLRNEFGTQYDKILMQKFTDAKKNKNNDYIDM